LKTHSLCTILYEYDYNLGIEVREVDNGEDDDYSMLTISPAKLRTMSALQVRVKEHEGGVATTKTFCSKAEVT